MIKIQNQITHPSDLHHQWLQDNGAKTIVNSLSLSPHLFQYHHVTDLEFEVNFRLHIIQSAYALDQSKVSFATFYYSRCNQDYWQLTNEGGFRLRTNVEASDAIQDIFNHGKQYAFECATAMMIILYHAYLTTVGPTIFNQHFASLYLWDWHAHKNYPLQSSRVDQGIPGDVRYFKNPDVNPRTPQWQGENTIQLLNQKYYGHGVGIKDEAGVIQELNKNRKPGASRDAYLLSQATRPDFRRLQNRKDYGNTRSESISAQFGEKEYFA